MELLRQLEGGGGDCADECDSIPRRGNAAVAAVSTQRSLTLSIIIQNQNEQHGWVTEPRPCDKKDKNESIFNLCDTTPYAFMTLVLDNTI
jgi:hypothetical protein